MVSVTQTGSVLAAPLRGSQLRVAAGVLGIVLGLLVLPPVWYLIRGSLYITNIDGSLGDFTLGYYWRLISEPVLLNATINTGLYALGSTAVALAVGGIQAWIVERTDTPLKSLAHFGSILALGVPHILYVIAWLLVLGNQGPFNAALQQWLHRSGPIVNVYSLWGMILVEGFLWSPLAFRMLSPTLRAANAEFEEAALVNGAGRLATAYHISLKLVRPVILALGLLVFIRTVESFEVPALVGLPGQQYVLTTHIYRSVQGTIPPDLGEASSFGVILLLVTSVLLWLYSRMARHAERYQTVTGKGYRPRAIPLGRWRYLTGAILLVDFLMVLVVPIGILLWASLLPFYQTVSRSAFGLFTLVNYRVVLQAGSYFDSARNTLVVAAGSATVTMFLAALAGWLAARRRPMGWLLDQLGSMPLVFPGIVLGVALMQLYLSIPVPIYGTLWSLLVAYVVRYMPYGMRYSYSGVLQIHRELEEAAEVSGASPLLIFRRIIFPLIGPSIVSGWLYIFLLASRELTTAVFLSGPSSQVLAVTFLDLWSNGQATELAAFGLVWTCFMVAVASLFWILARRVSLEAYA